MPLSIDFLLRTIVLLFAEILCPLLLVRHEEYSRLPLFAPFVVAKSIAVEATSHLSVPGLAIALGVRALRLDGCSSISRQLVLAVEVVCYRFLVEVAQDVLKLVVVSLRGASSVPGPIANEYLLASFVIPVAAT